jgi:hypothetical protein
VRLTYPAISQAPPILPYSRLPKPIIADHQHLPIHYLQFVLPTSNSRSPYKTHSRHPAGGLAQ